MEQDVNQTGQPARDSNAVQTSVTIEAPAPPENTAVPMATEVTMPPEASPARSDDLWCVKSAHVATLALLACLAVFHGFRPDHTLAPTDALKLVAPWATPDEDYVARNEQLLDQTVQFVPWTIYAKERLAAGQIPLWNPHAQLGAPFLGNGQSALFYPTTLLHLYLPETWSWTLSAAARLFLAGLGAWALAGHYGLRGAPRLLAGVAFMLCGFNVVWLNHPQMNVMPLLPWAVLLTEKLLLEVTLVRVIFAIVIFAVQFLGGHPATSLHLLLTCGLVMVFRAFVPAEEGDTSSPRWRGPLLRGAVATGAAVVLAFALAAVQWLPLMEYARHSGAAMVRQEKLAAERGKIFTLDARYLIGMGFPYANGYPPDRKTPFEMRQATGLPNTNELAPGWVGTIPLLLAVFAIATRWRRGTVLMWTIIGAIATAIAIRLPLIDHAVQRIPGLNVAQNARLLGVTALALALLSGFGLEALAAQFKEIGDMPKLRKRLALAAGGVAALAVVLTLILLIGKGTIVNRGIVKAKDRYDADPVHEHSWAYVEKLVRRVHTELTLTGVRLLIPASMLGGAAGILWLHRRQREKGAIGLMASPYLWIGLVGADLLAFGVFFNPGADRETYFPPTAAIEKLQELNRAAPARHAATFRTLIPETSTAFRLDDIRGYDALAPQRFYKWWDHEGIGDLPEYMRGYLSRFDRPEHRAWGLLNLGYLLTAPHHPAPSAESWQAVHAGEDANVYQAKSIRPRAWVAPRAEVYESADAVLDRVAKMDFNPDEVVLLDKDVAWDVRRRWTPGSEQLDDPQFWNQPSSRLAGAAPRATVQFLDPVTKDSDRPEVVRIQITGATAGGWLVLADSYFPGWTAAVIASSSGGGGGGDARGRGSSRGGSYGHEAAIVPAYGVLRAVQLPPGHSSLRVEFRYRPWTWRIGAAVSASALVVLLILIGLAIFRRVGSAHHVRATTSQTTEKL